MAAQVAGRPEIDFPPQHVGELVLHTCELDEARRTARLELDQQVDVAVWPCRALQGGAKEREPPDAVRAAESCESIAVRG